MNLGSFFKREISRTPPSWSPGGSVSCSMSVTKPAAYSRAMRLSICELIQLPGLMPGLIRLYVSVSAARCGPFANPTKLVGIGAASKPVPELAPTMRLSGDAPAHRFQCQTRGTLLLVDHCWSVARHHQHFTRGRFRREPQCGERNRK